MTASFRPCAIVPSYNHWKAAGAVIQRLRDIGLPVFIIDDGSDETARVALAALHRPGDSGALYRFDVNQGKGGAVIQGMRMAMQSGFTHAVQVDADGQHDLDAIAALLDLARRHPGALITGTPVYDETIPLGRAIGRWITHFWVWIETLSFQIPDSMCGFRVYPLGAIGRLMASGARIGRRMDFDIEIAVRLFWAGTPVVTLPVRVIYPPDNTSNFRMLRDNIRISLMHTRLVITMLFRWPALLRRRPARLEPRPHWPKLAERGFYFGLRFCAAAYRLLGRRGCLAVLAPVVLYFYLTGRAQRRASSDFLRRAFRARGETREPGFRDGYRHFLSFAARSLDTFIGWVGGLPADALVHEKAEALREAEGSPRGALFIVAHVGNVDVSRALLDAPTRARLNILVHTRHAENYNRLLREFNPAAAVNCFQVTELGPETAVLLKERVERGDWVVIAGDRTPIGSDRTSLVPFLGEAAPFTQGPYILAHLLDCPVYTLFSLRRNGRYHVSIERFAERIVLPRQGRDAALAEYAAAFARRLESTAVQEPFQWYNFFDFWARHDGTD